MFSRTQPEMMQKIYQSVWLLLHALFRLFVTVHGTWLHTLRMVALSFEPERTDERDDQLIGKCRADLAKLPRHVAVILNENDDGADRLARLIRWTEQTGIEHISFFDYRGCIETLRPDLYAEVRAHQQLRHQANGSAANNGGHANGAQSNGTGNGSSVAAHQPTRKPIAVHLIDPELNRTHLVDVSRELCARSVAPKDIDIPTVNAAVEQALNALPEPELAFYFDEHCCTYGLSPWQTRLTEFVRLERRASDVQLGSYLRALYKYSKCEQRFGK